MKRRCGRLVVPAATMLVFCAASIARGQVVLTEIMHSPGGSDALWEWVEIRNISGTALDLDGWVFDDDDDAHFGAANISSAGGSRNTIVPAGGVAVLYAGSPLGFDASRFNNAWGGGLTLIAVDGFTSLTATDAIGLWSSHEAYLNDVIPGATSSPRRTFANAVASIDYSEGFPASGNGRSIAWNGTGSITNGQNWLTSQAGVLGAFTSVQTTTSGAQINSTNDRGNPGVLPAGSAAAGLLITEIMFAPQSPLVTVGYSSNDFEWIEVFNNTAATINFNATPHVFDDNAGGQLTSPNVNSGTLAAGQVGVFFNNLRISVEDMQAMWGADLNYIPVSNWPALNNNTDTIAIWNSMSAYNSEPVTGTGRTHENAIAAVTYNTLANQGWPTSATGNSIWLHNLSGDPNIGQNWLRANAPTDVLSRNALPIYQDAVDHPGGDVGSPGHAPAYSQVGLQGDFNGDLRVDAADYIVWRKTGGTPTQYNEWRANFGATAGGGGALSGMAIPEPTGLSLAMVALIAGALIRRDRD